MPAGKPPASAVPMPRRRLSPADREEQIVQKAIAVFSESGLTASTRDLAKALGVTQPLLYRYFSTKEALIERVYDEVFFRPWNEEWEAWLSDRSSPMADRLRRYFKDYARFITRSDLVRLHMYAGLANNPLIHRFIENLRESHFRTIARELRHEFDLREPMNLEEENDEIELIWASHSSIFYMGVREWIYGVAPPRNIDGTIDMLVDGFLLGAPAALRLRRIGDAVASRSDPLGTERACHLPQPAINLSIEQ